METERNETSPPRYLVVVQAAEEGGYVAFVPDLRGCVTQGETLEEVLGNIREAMGLWLAVEAEEGHEPPRSSALLAAWVAPEPWPPERGENG